MTKWEQKPLFKFLQFVDTSTTDGTRRIRKSALCHRVNFTFRQLRTTLKRGKELSGHLKGREACWGWKVVSY